MPKPTLPAMLLALQFAGGATTEATAPHGPPELVALLQTEVAALGPDVGLVMRFRQLLSESSQECPLNRFFDAETNRDQASDLRRSLGNQLRSLRQSQNPKGPGNADMQPSCDTTSTLVIHDEQGA